MSTPNTCPQCNNSTDNDSTFCKHCGFDLRTAVSDTQQTSVEPQAATFDNSFKTRAVIALVVVAFAAILVILIRQNRSHSDEIVSSSSTPATQVSPKSDFSKFYQGAINNQYQIQMHLIRAGDSLSGKYLYTKNNWPISIKGTIDAQNNLVINEFDVSGNQTGTFKGKFLNNNIEGNWSKPHGDVMPFSLTESTESNVAPQLSSVTSTPTPTVSSQPTPTASSGYELSQAEMMTLMKTRGVWNMYSGWEKYNDLEIVRVGAFNKEGKYWPVQIKVKKPKTAAWERGQYIIFTWDVRILKNDYGDWEARRIG